MTGVNYADLAMKPEEGGPQSFSEGFIGDYVRKLENFVEAYTLDNNFHEGTDTAVLSLKNDLMNVKKACSTSTPNILFNAGQLDSGISPGWGHAGCPTQTVNGEQQPASDCLAVSVRADAPSFKDAVAANGAKGYSLTFGASSTADSGLLQTVSLPAGLFRFSWYTRESMPASGTAGGATAAVVLSDQPITIVNDDVLKASPPDAWVQEAGHGRDQRFGTHAGAAARCRRDSRIDTFREYHDHP
jgi:hypothetical protein